MLRHVHPDAWVRRLRWSGPFLFFICDHDVPWLFEGIDIVNVMMVTRVREDLIAFIQCAKIYVSVWRGESEDPSFPIVTLFSCHIRFTNS